MTVTTLSRKGPGPNAPLALARFEGKDAAKEVLVSAHCRVNVASGLLQAIL